MKNLVNEISNKEAVSNFKITEAFFSSNEFYMTSEWNVPFEIAEEIENQLRSL